MSLEPFAWLRRLAMPRSPVDRRWAARRPSQAVLELERLEVRWLPSVISFSSSTASINENDKAGAVTLTVQLDKAPSGKDTVTVNYATSDGTAGKFDYNGVSGTLTFNAGETSKTFSVSIQNDTLDEDDEYFTASLSNPSAGSSLGTPSTVTVPIVDDDPPPTVQLSASSYSLLEGKNPLTVTVSLNTASGKTVTVDYATSAG